MSRSGQPCAYCVDGWTRRRRGVLWWLALVALLPALACCVLGVIVGVRDGWAYTVDGLILESIGCVAAAIALPVLIDGE